jgi:putative membrane protein
MLRLTLAALHLIALGIGLGAVWARSSAAGERPLGRSALKRLFAADAWWGVAAVLWLVTGLWRLLGATEKATTYYMHNHAFMAKMGLFVGILALEIWPMVVLIRWRAGFRRSGDDFQPDVAAADRIRFIGRVQAALVVLMVVTAVIMARGYGA